jgi:hypothetical protein
MGVGDESVPGLAQRRMHKEEATRTNFISGFLRELAALASRAYCERIAHR